MIKTFCTVNGPTIPHNLKNDTYCYLVNKSVSVYSKNTTFQMYSEVWIHYLLQTVLVKGRQFYP